MFFLSALFLGESKQRQTQLGPSEWWAACADHRGRHAGAGAHEARSCRGGDPEDVGAARKCLEAFFLLYERSEIWFMERLFLFIGVYLFWNMIYICELCDFFLPMGFFPVCFSIFLLLRSVRRKMSWRSDSWWNWPSSTAPTVTAVPNRRPPSRWARSRLLVSCCCCLSFFKVAWKKYFF